LRGNYLVSDFRINGHAIPYSPLDTTRWQEATFENWSTLTFRVNKPTQLDLSNGGGDPQRDINRTFEISGVGGGQRVFYYQADEKNKVLYLQDKFKPIHDRRNRAAGVGGDGGTDANLNTQVANPEPVKNEKKKDKEWISPAALANIGDEVYKIDPRAITTRRKREYAEPVRNEHRKRMVLNYQTTDGNRVFLSGIDENKDSIQVTLDRVDRKYVLSPSSLNGGKY
ncbi:MAG TPA: hypothetical protein VK618_04645, partial [Flavitalea sp.]|nr:hypothetical protein [Flavitalea sp.]